MKTNYIQAHIPSHLPEWTLLYQPNYK